MLLFLLLLLDSLVALLSFFVLGAFGVAVIGAIAIILWCIFSGGLD